MKQEQHRKNTNDFSEKVARLWVDSVGMCLTENNCAPRVIKLATCESKTKLGWKNFWCVLKLKTPTSVTADSHRESASKECYAKVVFTTNTKPEKLQSRLIRDVFESWISPPVWQGQNATWLNMSVEATVSNVPRARTEWDTKGPNWRRPHDLKMNDTLLKVCPD